MRTILAVTRKELRQIVRDRRTLLIMAFVPAFFLLVFGYALNFDVRHVALAIEDRDGTSESRGLISAFINSGYFDFVAAIHSPEGGEWLLDRNQARAILVIPEGFSRAVTTGGTAPVQVIINGDNANTATAVIGYAMSILQTASAGLPGAAVLRPLPVVMEPRVWYNPELRSALFLVPGLIAYLTMLMSVTSTALSIVREKESGTIEQVRMAPVSTLPFILGKTLPYFFISLVSAALVFLASQGLFGLPMRGNWLTLTAALSIYLLGALATGLFVSTVADTQQVAFQIALLVSLLPTLMLSGFIFPIASMPAFLQGVTHIVPARYFLVALRSIVLKGTGALQLLPEFGALALYAMVMLGLASLRLARARV
ncbi:MAG: ABC transporter permease [Acidobacteriota bacterium]|nr:ABC transporter permease [Acidobacteriota bacterium]